MKQTISSQEWETLSAYLDAELEPKALQALEARLQTEPELSNALDNLRTTQALLKRAPQAQTPHHFILTREMAAAGGGWFSRISLSVNTLTAVASLLLVAVVLGDILTFGVPSFLTAASAPLAAVTAAEPEMLVAPEAAGAAESADSADTATADDTEARTTDTDDAAAEEEEAADEELADEGEDASEGAEAEFEAQMKAENTQPELLLTRQNFRLAEIGLAIVALISLLLGPRFAGKSS